MKQILLALIIGFLGFTLVTADAEARRFGGGKSSGRSLFSSKPKQTQRAPTQQNAATRNNPASTRTSGASRWLGPLAGLVAGGLIASLLFGDGFEGFQFMDFLLIIGLVLGALWLFRTLRGGRQQSPLARQAHATASVGGAQAPAFETPEIGSGLGNQDDTNASRFDRVPSWFNEQEFLQGAKAHFVRLQAAWDVGDMKDIRDYTTPEMFAQLTLERQSYAGKDQFTEVVELDSELVGFLEESDKVTASVRFSGLVREEQGAEAKPLNEIWHVQRSKDDDNANWHVAGIQQESDLS